MIFRKQRKTIRNFYPRPPRGGRRSDLEAEAHGEGISIHALREEGDAAVNDLLQRHNISIHALREEGDPKRQSGMPPARKFLSTPSARRATSKSGISAANVQISIHALREEGDR